MFVNCKVESMSETEIQILNATIGAVSQYGMRRTSMSDIADRAKVSRQTVYNLFGNKDEIYHAAILHMAALWQDKARKRLATAQTLSEQLDVIFGVFSIDAFKFSRGKKDAEDMFVEAHLVAPAALSEYFAGTRALYAELLRPYEKALAKHGISVEGLADQIETACRGYKRDARSLQHLKELFGDTKNAYLDDDVLACGADSPKIAPAGVTLQCGRPLLAALAISST